MAIGDSWLTNYGTVPVLGIPIYATLYTSLSAQGYRFADSSNSEKGRRLAEFFSAQAGGRMLIDDVCKDYRLALDESNPPQVVFLSAGGNDVTYLPSGQPAQVLCGLLNRKQDVQDVKLAINGPALTVFLAALKVHYLELFRRLLAVEPAVPLVIHGYDHPMPELGGKRLEPCINANGWSMAEGRTIMAALIDQLNITIAGCAAHYPTQVHQVNLCGKLQALADNMYGGDVLQLWKNDMHPNQEGCDHLASSMVAMLPASIVPS